MASCMAQEGPRTDWSFHGDLLKQKFDTSYWSETWDDDTWHIRSIFIDMDGDGVEEMIALTTSEEDRTGDYWNIWGIGPDGKFHRFDLSGKITFTCRPDSFYKMTYRDQSSIVIGLGLNVDYLAQRNVKPRPDCKFTIVRGGEYVLEEMLPNVDDWFGRDDEIVGMERLYHEWYFGFDFSSPRDTPHNPQTRRPPYRYPKGNPSFGGGMEEPPGFIEFANRYRQEKKREYAADNRAVAVYAVFLDADNDGDADCYVASELDKLEDGIYAWELYTQHGEEFSMANDIVYPVESRKDLCGLPPVAMAPMKSFCRVVRLDVEPIFLIIDKIQKDQVRNTIMDINVHRVEKLRCKVYREGK